MGNALNYMECDHDDPYYTEWLEVKKTDDDPEWMKKSPEDFVVKFCGICDYAYTPPFSQEQFDTMTDAVEKDDTGCNHSIGPVIEDYFEYYDRNNTP